MTIRLNNVERKSHCWDKVALHANQRLTTLRATVENPRKTEAERLAAAWRIDELKELLAMAEAPKPDKPTQGFAD